MAGPEEITTRQSSLLWSATELRHEGGVEQSRGGLGTFTGVVVVGEKEKEALRVAKCWRNRARTLWATALDSVRVRVGAAVMWWEEALNYKQRKKGNRILPRMEASGVGGATPPPWQQQGHLRGGVLRHLPGPSEEIPTARSSRIRQRRSTGLRRTKRVLGNPSSETLPTLGLGLRRREEAPPRQTRQTQVDRNRTPTRRPTTLSWKLSPGGHDTSWRNRGMAWVAPSSPIRRPQ